MIPQADNDEKRSGDGATIAFPVVAIGASAGGIEAAVEFFRVLDERPGMAFVLIQHLKPGHESHLVEILARRVKQRVVEARDGAELKPDSIYVITPGTYLTLEGRVLRARPAETGHGPPSPIDVFFRSLAENGVQRAIGIILSGTGSDGTLGLKAIKENGGMTMAQDPEAAGQGGMPSNAIQAGVVDRVLPLEKLADTLQGYVNHPYVASSETAAAVESDEERHLGTILALLRVRAKHNFEHYRAPTLLRRIQRRMGIRRVTSYADYHQLLREDPAEMEELAGDLLISVTDFFRDPEAWETLQTRVVRGLVEKLDDGATIRAWVPGCATGEEAYSLAVLVKEELDRTQVWPKIQIFATDVSESAIERARAGVYPQAIAGEVGPERLRRFFREIGDDHHYRISQDIRDMVIFATQDLIADPPFTRLDLITCRNLLIYLKPEIQKKVISLFHLALRPGGHLFLGSAEGVGRSPRFSPLSKKWKIYRSVGETRHDEIGFPISGEGVAGDRSAGYGLPDERPEPRESRDFTRAAQQAIIDRLGPTCVIIDRDSEIQYYSGSTDKYLLQPHGEPTRDLFQLVRKSLRVKLRRAIRRAREKEEPVTVSVPAVERTDEAVGVRIEVSPLMGPSPVERMLLVSFEDVEEVPERRVTVEAPEADESAILELEQELAATREQLRNKIEQLETSNEELRAANEEVRSMNEELQSANEELETSKEELQALNEELTTVNQQLENKVDELETVNNDIKNLLSSTDLAMLFLSPDLRIRRFTPAMTRLVNLLSSDVGRSITDFRRAVTGEDLAEQSAAVLRDLQPVEQEVESEEGNYYIRRILPYRTEDDRIDGVVVTFIDVTQRVRDRKAREEVEAELRRVNESLDMRATQRTALLELLQDVVTAANQARSLEEALRVAVRRVCEYNEWHLAHAHVIADDESGELVPTEVWHAAPGLRFESFKRAIMSKRVRQGEGLLGHVLETGQPLWVDDLSEQPDWDSDSLNGLRTAFFLPIVTDSQTVGTLEYFSRTDMAREERFQHTMNNVSIQLGYLFERKALERRIAELADVEHRRIGAELHDSLGQRITAITLLTRGLQQKLEQAGGAEADRAAEIVNHLQTAKAEIAVLIEGLVPLEVRAESVGDALRLLADRSTRIYGVDCRFEGPETVVAPSDAAAMHLYRIAQEAIANAVKHGKARNVVIEIADDPTEGTRVLRVRDDGRGLSGAGESPLGMGIRIMRHRASLLGGELRVLSPEAGGAVVECVIGGWWGGTAARSTDRSIGTPGWIGNRR